MTNKNNTLELKIQPRVVLRAPHLKDSFNSLPLKSLPTGTKNTCSEGFLLAKHTHTNIPTMMELFAPPATWFCQSSTPHPQEPLQKGLAKAAIDGF
jgi:hypothetical protein